MSEVSQVCRAANGLSEGGDGAAGQSGVDTRLSRQNFVGGLGGRDGGQIVLALARGPGAERLPTQGGCSDAAEVRVALVSERALTRGTSRDAHAAVSGAGGDDEEAPAGLPGAGLGEVVGADLGDVGGGPAAGGDPSVGMPVVRVKACEVEDRAVVVGRDSMDSVGVDACEGCEAGDDLCGGARVRYRVLPPCPRRRLSSAAGASRWRLRGAQARTRSIHLRAGRRPRAERQRLSC